MNFERRRRDIFEAHRRFGWCTTPSGDVVKEIVRWKYQRRGPSLWHYAIRAYRRVVLARKDWRLPWR